MTDAPTPPAARAKRPGIRNADVPSDTLGLPDVGEGASATHFARDTVQGQVDENEEERGPNDAVAPRDRDQVR